MIIENLLARVGELQSELSSVRERLASVEEAVASLRVQTSTGAKTITEHKATSPTTSVKTAAK